MLSLLTVFAMHVPPSDYLRCEDYHWLKNAIDEAAIFTPREKFEIKLRWMEHTEASCFDNKDAND